MIQMRLIIVIASLCLAVGQVITSESEENWEDDPELTAGFIEGDMELDEAVVLNGMRDTTKRWPNGVVYYKFANLFDVDHVMQILKGMQIIESVSCIRFYPASDVRKAFIQINGEGKGCSSKVGFSGLKQNINLKLSPLGKGCFRLGSIMHELLHALGFYHQHTAHNRDQFIKINTQNIAAGKENYFGKRNAKISTDFGVGYDYGSVLHYGLKAFSKNGRNTIVALKPTNAVIGQRKAMSEKDIAKLNKMYKCNV